MASLQASHRKSCELDKQWSPVNDKALEDCTCQPTYYVVVRQGKKALREQAGNNRRKAEQVLRKRAVEEDEGTFQPVQNITFDAWADQWLAGLERRTNTVRGYTSTMVRGKAAFGQKRVRRITVEDLRALMTAMRADGLSDSTRAKHLRVLGACFASAIESGYAGVNPCRRLTRGERPQAGKRESAYFERDELRRLFEHVEAGVYRTLFLTALKTGMRLGELLALTWADVDLSETVIRVRRSYTDGSIGPTKSGERRSVDLTEELVELLGEWWGELGGPDDDRLVFPGPTKSGYLNVATVARELYEAMSAAEVPRIGPTGEKRTFHSFRHTSAKAALEHGLSITWLQRRLGHASITITIDRYGHWESQARRAEAQKLQGAFGV